MTSHSRNFGPADAVARYHIAVHPADLALEPSESYLYIQDKLIFSCAVSWAIGLSIADQEYCQGETEQREGNWKGLSEGLG